MIRKKKKKISVEEMKQFFLSIWEERQEKDARGNYFVRCFETGKKLGEYYKNNFSCYHHVLYKSSYPQYTLMKENVVIIHPDVHAQTHINEERTEKISAYKKELLNLLKQINENE